MTLQSARASTDNVCRILEWDSRFFGVRVARMPDGALSHDGAQRANAWCEAERVDCVYFLADSDDAETVRVAERHGFAFVDVRVTLECSLEARGAQGTDLPIRAAVPSDVPALRSIATVAHTDSRFYFDPQFPRERCDELYATWIEQSCRGGADLTLVGVLDDGPCGYLTCHANESIGSIGLVGVAPAARGRGVGRALVDGALAFFAAREVTRVRVVTQARNVAAQALYQRHGFRTTAVQLWYHRWSRPVESVAR